MANNLLSAIKGLRAAGNNHPGAAEKHAQILTRRSEVRGDATPCRALRDFSASIVAWLDTPAPSLALCTRYASPERFCFGLCFFEKVVPLVFALQLMPSDMDILQLPVFVCLSLPIAAFRNNNVPLSFVPGTSRRSIQGETLRVPGRAGEHLPRPTVAAGGVQLEYPVAPVAGAVQWVPRLLSLYNGAWK